MNYVEIIKRPIMSEKSMKLVSENKYMFEVSGGASKGAIKSVVESMFGVDVVCVNTIKNASKGKRSLAGSRKPYTRAGIKKAVITLKEGQKISLFDIKEKKK